MDAKSGPFGLAELIAPHDEAGFLDEVYEGARFTCPGAIRTGFAP